MYRDHVEPRVKLYVPKEESFPIPLEYIDVTRATNTTLDLLLDSRMDDNWNVDGDRELSDHLWPEIWKNVSDAAQRREKQKCAFEKP